MPPPKSNWIDRAFGAAGLLLLGVYFFRLARPALKGGFSPDDCMNLYRSWIYPLRALIKANLIFFMASDFIRPMGEAWYRVIFAYSGFHAGPFHAANLAFLLANLFLAYSIARRLTDNRLAALFTALLFCYERRWLYLYFDTGFIFDTLAFFFTASALLGYIMIRQQRRFPELWEAVGLIVLYICALNSKEMALALPAFLATYEFLYHPPPRWNEIQWKQYWLITLMGVLTLLFIAGRTGAMIANPAYKPEFTWTRFMATSCSFVSEMAARSGWVTPSGLLLFWAVTLLTAIVLRRRPLLFGWCFAFLAMLPIAFVPPRGGSQYYVPLFGWALYAGYALGAGAGWLFRRVARKPNYWEERIAAAVMLFAIVWPLYGHYKEIGMSEVGSITLEAPVTMAVAAQLHELYPTIPHGFRILFLDDPIHTDWENLIFIVQLSYHDPSLVVKRVKQMKQAPSQDEIDSYNAVIGYRGGRFVKVNTKTPPDVSPMISVGLLGPEFYHMDWSAATAAKPAKPGERIIGMAIDLGPVSPPVPAGHPFPHDPLAKVVAPVEVNVNGRMASVEDKLGAPGEIHKYRFDFVVPAETEQGKARVRLTIDGKGGPPVILEVKR